MLTKGNTPGRKRNQELNGGVPKGWQRKTPSIRPAPEYACDAQLYAIISTWFDEDIIAAAIANCFDNGCDRVYVLDNDSPDDTEQEALRSGAHQVVSYTTEYYDDDLRITLQNDIIKRITEDERHKHLWWVVLDGDEFPLAPVGVPLKRHLQTLTTNIRVVGSNFIDLYPTSETQYVRGTHPALCFTHGVWRRGGIQRYCQCGHWKHSVLRYDDGKYDIALFRGNHGVALSPDCKTQLLEPHDGLVYFHAPLRNRDFAERRLTTLCGSGRDAWDVDVTNDNGAVRRWRSLEAIYEQHWHEVELPHTQVFGRPVTGLALYEWRKLLPENFRFPYLQRILSSV